MLKTLKAAAAIAKGDVAKRDDMRLYDGRVQTFNGTACYDAPLGVNIDATVQASAMVKAVAACGDGAEFSDADKSVMVKNGALKVRVPKMETVDEPYIDDIEGTELPITKDDAALIAPFFGVDETREWMNGIIAQDGYLYGANGFMAIRKPCDFAGATVVPASVVNVMASGGYTAIVNDNAIALRFDDGAWYRSALYGVQAPELARIFTNVNTAVDNMVDVTDELRGIVKRLIQASPYAATETRITFDERGISANAGDIIDSTLTEWSFMGEKKSAMFNAAHLSTVLEVAQKINISDANLKPCYWTGEGVDGIIMGMRV